MNALPFSQSFEMTPAEAEIRAWLKSNRALLAGRESNEVAYMAVLCGFDLDDVCATLSTFDDAMRGTHVGNRAAFQVWRVEMAIEDFNRIRDDQARSVKEQDILWLSWKDLVDYTITGQEAA